MPLKLKDVILENDKAGLLALGLVLLVTGQALSKNNQPILLFLRYVFFAASLIIYGYVFYIHNQERIEKKKNGKINNHHLLSISPERNHSFFKRGKARILSY